MVDQNTSSNEFHVLLTKFLSFILQQYDRYFQANAVEKGGSFYLQSKIYRAKEMLDDYIKEKETEAGQKGAPKDDK